MEVLENIRSGMWCYLILRSVLLTVEGIVLFRRKRLRGDFLTNVGCGALLFVFYKFVADGAQIGMMFSVASLASQSLEVTWGLFFITLLLADLSFYALHVAAHRIRLLWADHSVHHSSSELDLSTNLRNSLFLGLYVWVPMIPLLLVGVNPYLVAMCLALVNDFPFILHTERIGRLPGPVELIFNTPSHHRVHHARNQDYLNRNFGGVLIIWDRMFGTFAEEVQPCVYGVSDPPRSRNPIRVMFYEWSNVVRDLLWKRGLRRKLWALLHSESARAREQRAGS